MMNFPEIDLKNDKLLISMFLIVISLLFFNVLEIKSLISIIVIIYIVINYTDFKNKLSDDLFNKDKVSVNYNNNIRKLLNKIKKYKKNR